MSIRLQTRIPRALIVGLFGCATLTANAADIFEVTVEKAAAANPTPLLIVPFAGASDISKTVTADLNQTTLKPTQYSPLVASGANTASVQQQVADLRATGFSHVVTGRVVNEGARVVIAFDVIDTTTGMPIQGTQTRIVEPNAQGLSYGAHLVADRVHELITGIKGDFSGRIVYIEEQGKGASKTSMLKVMDADGQNKRTLETYPNASIFSPVWSPDGQSIAYSVQRQNALPVIYLRPLNGTPRLITPYKGNNLGASFHPDGQTLLFSGSHEGSQNIYRLHLPSGHLSAVTQDTGAEMQPSYLPTGAGFIYMADGGSNQTSLYQYTFGTGQKRRLVTGANPTVSPDGTKIAFLQGRNAVVGPISGGVAQTLGATGVDESASFSPNSTRVVFAQKHGASTALVIHSLETGQKITVPTQGTVRSPAWSVGN